MKRDLVAIQNVKDIQETGKRWLEDVLGSHLQENQQVFIMVFTAGVTPDDDKRRNARAGIERTFEKTEEYAISHAVRDEEIDAAVDEAMQHVRPRSDS